MTKRRDFIRKSVIGTTGIAIGSMGFSCNSPSSTPAPTVDAQPQKDWHTDPEWSKIKYGEWGGPGVSAGPGPMDTIQEQQVQHLTLSLNHFQNHIPSGFYFTAEWT